MENTTENNKLIAEFMGVTPRPNLLTQRITWYSGIDLQHAGLPFRPGIDGNGTNELKFHSSWEWIMPVVEKINLLDDYSYSVTILTMDCSVMNNKCQIICECSCVNTIDTLILSVYSTVCDFIKWYNLNK